MYFQEIFIKPWIHASPFLVGILCAYLIYTLRKPKIPILITIAGWLISTAAALAIIFGLFPYYDPNKSIPIETASFYAALHRFGWGFVISWIIFVCSHNGGGLINKFLSWRLFRPLSKLTLSTYLVALPVQMILRLRFRQSITHDTYTMVSKFIKLIICKNIY